MHTALNLYLIPKEKKQFSCQGSIICTFRSQNLILIIGKIFRFASNFQLYTSDSLGSYASTGGTSPELFLTFLARYDPDNDLPVAPKELCTEITKATRPIAASNFIRPLNRYQNGSHRGVPQTSRRPTKIETTCSGTIGSASTNNNGKPWHTPKCRQLCRLGIGGVRLTNRQEDE